jgi:transposase
MIQITPQMKILVALEPADFRKGIDGLARVCKASLQRDPFEGTVFVFRNRRSTAIKLLVYDGQGFWLCQKRMSEGRFRWWPNSTDNRLTQSLAAHQLQVLFSAGNPSNTSAAPDWRPVGPTLRCQKKNSS